VQHQATDETSPVYSRCEEHHSGNDRQLPHPQPMRLYFGPCRSAVSSICARSSFPADRLALVSAIAKGEPSLLAPASYRAMARPGPPNQPTRRCANSLTTYIQDSVVSRSTRNSAIAEGPRDASCQLKSCQLPRNSAETTCTTTPEQIEVMKLEGYSGAMCNKHVHSTMTRSSRFHCPIGVVNKPTTDELWISPLY